MKLSAILYLAALPLWVVFDLVSLAIVCTWPSVKGKSWLVAALICFLINLFVVIGSEISTASSDEILMGPDEYEYLFNVGILTQYVGLSGKILLAISVFQLRGVLKSFVEAKFLNGNENAENPAV